MNIAVSRACVLIAGVLLSWSHTALANDGALAEELFRQGQSLMSESRYEEACPKLAESQRLESSTGTLLNLAVCHEKQGKLASAWNEFQEALVVARRDGREDRMRFAEEHIASIEPNLSRLTITLPKESDVPGLEVQLDGTKMGRPALGVALPVDPGVHEILVTAPDKKPWKTSIEIPEGPGKQSVSIPALLDAPKDPKESQATTDVSVQDEGARDGSTQRSLAYGAGALGLVGVALGTAFGIDALSKFNRSNENGCNGNDCNTEGADLRDAARTSGNVSTVAFIAGGVLVGTAVVLYFTAPRSQKAAVSGSSGTERGYSGSGERIWSASLRPSFGGGIAQIGTTW